MEEQGHSKTFSRGTEFKWWLGRVFFNKEKELFAMNSVENLNCHAIWVCSLLLTTALHHVSLTHIQKSKLPCALG